MSDTPAWKGRSKGSRLGYSIFIFVLKTSGLKASYFLLRFVAFYYFVFARSTRANLWYHRNIHGKKGLRAYAASYRNYFLFGQVLIDKFAMLSDLKRKYFITHEGFEENLKSLQESETGAILVSGHLGNWEIAGQKLERLQTRFNVLMYDNEASEMRDYLQRTLAQKNYNIIPIRPDMSHLVQLHNAFRNKEILVMHGDRYLPGAETIEKTFMGKRAVFPAGPFIMASKFGVPVIVVFSMKDGPVSYHFYAKQPIRVKRARGQEELRVAVDEASDKYIHLLEEMLKKYPEQWFNFYDFWKPQNQ